MVSVTWGSQVGTATGFSWAFEKEDVILRNEGSVNPNVVGTIRKNLVATVDFLEGTIPAESDVAASLVIVSKTTDGTSKTTTLSNMIPRGVRERMDRESPPAVYSVDFICKGAVSIPTVS